MENKTLSRYNCNVFKRILDFLFSRADREVNGKLFVSGSGILEFTLKHKPQDVSVHFENECNPIPCVPCDPGTEDFLEWSIISYKHYHVLIIEWSVNSMREIAWKAR